MISIPDKPQARPVLSLDRTPTELALEAASGITLIYCIVNFAGNWTELPDSVPTHFGFSGEPDGWGSKSGIVILPIISLVIFSVLTILRNYPHLYNYPKPVTPENAERLYRCAQHMLVCLKFEVLLIFTYIQVSSIAIAKGESTALHPAFLPFALTMMFGTTGFFILRLFQEAKEK